MKKKSVFKEPQSAIRVGFDDIEAGTPAEHPLDSNEIELLVNRIEAAGANDYVAVYQVDVWNPITAVTVCLRPCRNERGLYDVNVWLEDSVAPELHLATIPTEIFLAIAEDIRRIRDEVLRRHVLALGATLGDRT